MNDRERYMRDRAAVMAMVKFLLIALIICIIGFFASKVVIILVPFLIGFLLAKTSYAIVTPLAKLLSKKQKDATDVKPGKKKPLKTRLASVAYVILMILLAVVIIWLIFVLILQVNNLITTVSRLAAVFDITDIKNGILTRLSIEHGGFLTKEMINTIEKNLYDMWLNLLKAIPTFLQNVLAWVLNLIGDLPYGIFFVVSIILSGFYFINDGPEVLKFYINNTPNRSFRNKAFKLINNLSVTLFQALGGYMLLLIITAVEAYIVFALAGVKYALILALITGVIDFMPVLGISATMIPTIVYLVIHEQYVPAVIIVVGMAVMTVVRRVIEPPIIGKSMHIHPLLTLIAMALGVYIWGAIGFLLGPVVTIIALQIIMVFDIDKIFMNYMSNVLNKVMYHKEDDEQLKDKPGKLKKANKKEA